MSLRINKAELFGYKRFALSRIQKLTWNLDSDLQIVLGTNGSGKSSLLTELVILPPSGSDFQKDGYVIIDFEFNNRKYQVKSDFKTSAGRHTLIEFTDSEPIYHNEHGTSTAQREIIRQLFGLTPEIKALITGKAKFTDMSPSIRRHWFTQFSTTDLTFAFKLHKDLSSMHRDTAGALKHLNSRIAQETSNLLSQEDVSQFKERSTELQTKLTELMVNKNPNLGITWERELSALDKFLAELNQVSNFILDFELPTAALFPLDMCGSLDDLENLIVENNQSLRDKESALRHYSNEYEAMEGLINAIKENGVEGFDELQLRYDALGEKLQSATQRLSRDDILEAVQGSAEEIWNDTVNMFDSLDSVLNEMPLEAADKFSQAERTTRQAEFDQLNLDTNRCLNRISQIEDRIDHADHAETVNCPKCAHGWKVGVGENEVQELQKKAEHLRGLVAKFKVRIAELAEYLSECDKFLQVCMRYKSIVNTYPRLSYLWNRLADGVMYAVKPAEALRELWHWREQVKVVLDIAQLSKERNRLAETLEHGKIIAASGTAQISARGKVLLEEIEQATSSIEFLKAQRKELLAYKTGIETLLSKEVELTGLITKVSEQQRLVVETLLNSEITAEISALQSQLAMVQSSLSKMSALETIVVDLKTSAQQMELDKAAYNELVNILSPTDGFIAEQLQGSINTVVAQLNAIIGFIWTHDLIIRPCGMEGEDLDYKFPMFVDGNDSPVPDVSDGSSAQTDVVNLAFRMLSYVHLGLNGYPLFLDEEGRTFDEQHRTNLMTYIKETVGTEQYSQAFLISHYAANHGSFLNADVLVLDSSNISVPDRHNQHVTIEYAA